MSLIKTKAFFSSSLRRQDKVNCIFLILCAVSHPRVQQRSERAQRNLSQMQNAARPICSLSLSHLSPLSHAVSSAVHACTAPLMMIKALMQYNMRSRSLAFSVCDTSQLIARAAHTFYVPPFALNNVKIQLLPLLSGDIAWRAACAHSSIMDTLIPSISFISRRQSQWKGQRRVSHRGDPRSQNPFHEFTIKTLTLTI